MDTANYEFSRLLDIVLKNAYKMDKPESLHPVKLIHIDTFIYFIETLIQHYKELGLYIEKEEENGINNETRGWFKTGYREI